MERTAHVLSRAGQKPYPDAVVVVQALMRPRHYSDSDTWGTMLLSSWRARLGAVVGRRILWGHEVSGVTADEFWEWCLSRTDAMKRVHLYSADARDHAAALDLWDRLDDKTLTLAGADPYDAAIRHDAEDRRRDGYVVLESPPTIIAFAKPTGGTCYVWLDPANYGAGKCVRQVHSPDGRYVEPVAKADDMAVLLPRTNDLVASVVSWLDTYYDALRMYRLNAPAHTAASQAMDGFRSGYLKSKIVIHDSAPAVALERESLVGGRCEAAYLGELWAEDSPELPPDGTDQPAACLRNLGTIYHVDANALYPSVAAANALPTRLVAICKNIPLPDLIEAAKCCCVIADVRLDIDTPLVPCRLNDVVAWPVGSFDTVLCGPELLLAHRWGAEIKCREVAVYEGSNLYGEWVAELYQARCFYKNKGEDVMANVVKSILNASFGKWSQQSKRWIDAPSVRSEAPYSQWFGKADANGVPTQWRSIGWKVQTLVKQGELPDGFPGITSYINSLGRVKLWDWICIAGRDNVYYYDTDSLFVNSVGLNALSAAGEIDPQRLGRLSIRGEYGHVRLIGRQAYVADGKLTLSGVSDPYVTGKSTTCHVLKQPPVNHYLWHNRPPEVDRTVATVTINRPYRHGHVGPDGRVTPIEVDPRARNQRK